MKLNHLNLTVTDVRAAGAFLERYCGLHSEGGNAGMAFLSDGNGFLLSLMKAGRATTVAYPGHLSYRLLPGGSSDGGRGEPPLT